MNNQIVIDSINANLLAIMNKLELIAPGNTQAVIAGAAQVVSGPMNTVGQMPMMQMTPQFASALAAGNNGIVPGQLGFSYAPQHNSCQAAYFDAPFFATGVHLNYAYMHLNRIQPQHYPAVLEAVKDVPYAMFARSSIPVRVVRGNGIHLRQFHHLGETTIDKVFSAPVDADIYLLVQKETAFELSKQDKMDCFAGGTAFDAGTLEFLSAVNNNLTGEYEVMLEMFNRTTK